MKDADCYCGMCHGPKENEDDNFSTQRSDDGLWGTVIPQERPSLKPYSYKNIITTVNS